ncbi:MAG: hypothetical protein ABDH32_02005 [Candidatus Caldarchaeales archaeon]
MRTDILTIGVFLMIIGMVVFFIFYSKVSEYQTWIGQFARALFPRAEREYRIYFLGALLGAILLVSGLGIALYGAVSQKK